MALNLDAAIRAKITAGVLAPTAQAVDSVTGGCGEPCDACGDRILSTDMEYGVKATSRRAFRLHRRCYWAWVDACALSPMSRPLSPETNST